MNMFLHAKDAARIEWCDTLNSPTLIEGDHLMKFDIVVANPPRVAAACWGGCVARGSRNQRCGYCGRKAPTVTAHG